MTRVEEGAIELTLKLKLTAAEEGTQHFDRNCKIAERGHGKF